MRKLVDSSGPVEGEKKGPLKKTRKESQWKAKREDNHERERRKVLYLDGTWTWKEGRPVEEERGGGLVDGEKLGI